MLDALSRSDETALRDMLGKAPTFVALGASLQGTEDVLARIARQPTREIYRQVSWALPELTEDGTRAAGHLHDGAARSGCVLSFRFEGDRVVGMQHQNLPPRPARASPLRLTPALKHLIDNALATRHPMLIAYADASGQPVLSFRGSLQVFSDDQLALWVRNSQGGMLRALQENPRLAAMYRDEGSKATYQFQGRARIATHEAERQRIYAASAPAEQAHDFARLGVAVIIDLDRVEGYAGLGAAGQIDRILMVRRC